MKHHELSELFPMLQDVNLELLANEIKAHGLLKPIVTLDGEVLDGRNRLAACAIAKVEPRYVPWGELPPHERGESPLDYVIQTNLHRRHLTDDQRAMVAAEIATRSRGRPVKGDNKPKPPTQAEAAALLNVPKAKVGRASRVAKNATKEDREAVKAGKKSLANAAKAIPRKAPGKKREPRVSPKDKLLAALDDWWLANKDDFRRPPMVTPEQMLRHFAKLIERTL